MLRLELLERGGCCKALEAAPKKGAPLADQIAESYIAGGRQGLPAIFGPRRRGLQLFRQGYLPTFDGTMVKVHLRFPADAEIEDLGYLCLGCSGSNRESPSDGRGGGATV